ncbi:hypothetical protein MMC24_004191 [Lignoscripta atroalba]|nr:hypothetical protein [Lignoscripta atroalba]
MSTATEVPRQGEVGRAKYSSSPELSSPPKSPDSPSRAVLAQANAIISKNNNNNNPTNAGGEKSSSATTTVHAKANSASTATAAPKRARKKKEAPATNSANHASAAADAREPKVRKPRVPSSNPNPRSKKQKSEHPSDAKTITVQASRQPKITDLVGSAQPQSNFNVLVTSTPHQNRNNEAIPTAAQNLVFLAPGQTTQTSPRSTGQNYDPIRSTTTDAPSVSHTHFNVPQVSPQKSANRASESPSISSLIDPPLYPFPPPSTSKPTPTSHAQSPTSTPNLHLSPPAPIHIQPAPKPGSVDTPSTLKSRTPSTAMDVDTETMCPPLSKPQKSATGTSTGPSSNAPSPKPSRQKEPPLRLPPGNGLLSSALFGGPTDSMGPEKTAPTVILHVPLNGEINKYVNFARMAEERYGFNALHPRLAAQRERLARVAAAGAALENAGKAGTGQSGSGMSADEMSVDLSEGDGEGDTSNVEMGGMGAGGSDSLRLGDDGTKLEKPQPRKRKMKEDQYDKDDPFVDDTELAWEEQAAASKDGFFVYQGPLVPEGEKPAVERADGTVKRGRGRGRGGTTRGAAASKGAATAGGGSGSGTNATRGNTTTRKPRVTKAARAMMEQEKVEREKMAILAAKPSTYPT